MGHEHMTIGRKTFEAVVEEVWENGGDAHFVPNPNQPRLTGEDIMPLRMARFWRLSQARKLTLVVEEVLVVDDRDCDGRSVVSTIVYPLGRRPRVASPVVLEG